MRAIMLALTIVMLTGCGLALQNRLTSAMEESKAAYKSCLAKSKNCEREQLMYEADLAAVSALAATRPKVIPAPVVIQTK
jgi:outer membrane lipopolysaccharide assembly protein LptE/RlpB